MSTKKVKYLKWLFTKMSHSRMHSFVKKKKKKDYTRPLITNTQTSTSAYRGARTHTHTTVQYNARIKKQMSTPMCVLK